MPAPTWVISQPRRLSTNSRSEGAEYSASDRLSGWLAVQFWPPSSVRQTTVVASVSGGAAGSANVTQAWVLSRKAAVAAQGVPDGIGGDTSVHVWPPSPVRSRYS